MNDSSQKRPHDDRGNKALKIAKSLMNIGLSPRVIEIDGLYIEMHQTEESDTKSQERSNFSDIESSTQSTIQPTVARVLEPGELARAEANSASQLANVRGYRVRARMEMERKLRDMDSGGGDE